MIKLNSFFFKSSKGQTRVIGEMLFFAIGVVILSYIIITFGFVQTGVSDISRTDQMHSVANYIKTGMIRLVELDNPGETQPDFNITIELPLSISGEDFGFEFFEDTDDGNEVKLRVFLLNDNEVSVTEELFNIGTDYTIDMDMFTGNAKYYVLTLDKSENKISMEYYRLKTTF